MNIDSASHGSILPGVALRLMVSVSAMLWVWLTWGPSWVQQCLPFYGEVFEWVAPDFRLVSLLVDRENMDQVVRATVAWKHMMVIGEHVIYPHPLGTANASTLLAHAFAGPMVALCCASVWPVIVCTAATTWAQRWWLYALQLLARFAVVMLLSVGLVAVDLPVVLAGEVWRIVLEQLSPETTSAVVLWASFMKAGGRYALGLCAGALAVAVVQRLRPGLT